MFEIDHLMIEVDDPLKAANQVSEKLGLPLAWPLTEKEEYTSIGVNFGSINIEFINFRVRFGVSDTRFEGFSGIAFKADTSLNESIEALKSARLSYRIGEKCDAHTTIPVEEEQVFPTVFLVKYNFDTHGWKQRLEREFAECAGGNFNIGTFKCLSIDSDMPANLVEAFNITAGNKNQIVFESTSAEPIVISDLIQSLEIVIG